VFNIYLLLEKADKLNHSKAKTALNSIAYSYGHGINLSIKVESRIPVRPPFIGFQGYLF
jgi:hypothetical protein